MFTFAMLPLQSCELTVTWLRRAKAVLIYRRTGILRTDQHLLGHSRIESTVR